MKDIVHTTGLSRTVKGRKLVADVELRIRQGEVYGLLGQNGAGKTTIMKMLAGHVAPTAGEISLFGQRLTASSKSALSRVGSIIEYPVFFEHMGAIDNLRLHAEYLGFYDEQAIAQALELVRLKDAGARPVKEFSLGMKQRLGIARAVITKPELIILDEPTNGLDPVGIKDMRDLVRMLNQEYGITFLVSSHILSEIEQVADRIGVVSEGRLTTEMSLEDIAKQRTDYIEIATPQAERAAYLLEHELGIASLKLLGGGRLRVYDLSRSQSEISRMLVLHDVEIEGIQKHVGTLEDYFYHQITGGDRIG
ncbi:ATP-binding cassette domain-containing protein [Paenibacillus sp. FSL W8-1187]|uniref:Bacitracin ABC transporter, ATP-binding protein n=1 Tax=Paenibacillus pasadenensis TaxID=217090 RepID=A0A2N5N169_9BACL|nr:ATP-binding cassette domain-containing protein [Paenibacillus pasadenensis]PLT44080.1 bacitracin ABC transporter, ATP-binding protein [Paenibacillus pasadenensis]